MHAVLQTVDLATGDDLDSTARAQALAEGIPQREAEIRALARSVLQSSTVRGAVTGGRYWREVPVAAVVDGVTVEGFVDLLIETLEGLVVVDYKTDQIATDDELDAAMERYRVQGAAYALALERALGAPVARCLFVSHAPAACRGARGRRPTGGDRRRRATRGRAVVTRRGPGLRPGPRSRASQTALLRARVKRAGWLRCSG